MDYSKEISMLKEENKKLKEDRDKYFGYLKDKDLECETQREYKEKEEEENEKLKEEIKKLKDEIEQEVDTSLGACEKIVEMRQFCMNIHNLMYGTRFDDEDIVSSFDFPLILKRLERDEYEKEGMPYIRKNQELREKIITQQDEIIEHLKTIKKLRLDEEKLVEATIASYREIKTLKEDRDKLKALFLDRDDEAFYSMDAVLQQAEDDFKDFNKAEAENEELKEEIQELKEKYEGELITQEEFVKRSQDPQEDGEVEIGRDTFCGIVKDINGQLTRVPPEEECQEKFGISQETFIILAQKSDCH